MKLFKTIYYSVIGVLLVLLVTLSCVDVAGTKIKTELDVKAAVKHVAEMTEDNSSSIYDETAHDNRISYIEDTLSKFGLARATVSEETADGMTKQDITMMSKPSFAAVETTLTGAERAEWVKEYTGKDPFKTYMTTDLTNIVAFFPAKDRTADTKTLMFMAHYDSVQMGKGANDDLSAVAAMLETINILAKNAATYRNDVMFVFTDGEEQGMLGAYAFKKKFIGYDDAYSRVGLANNFESRGNDGTVVMFQSSSNNYKLIQNWAKISSTHFSSSVADFAYSLMPNYTDFTVYNDQFPALNFANIGGGEVYHTQLDNEVSEKIINNHGAMMIGLVHAFADTDLTQLTSQNSGVFFNYLDIGTVVYSNVAAYVFGVLILLLLAGVIVMNVFTKNLDFKAIGKGAAVMVIALALSVLFGYVAYYAIAGFLSLCGVISFHAIGTLMYSSIPLMLFAGLLVVSFAAAMFVVFKRIFRIKAGDVSRGNVLIWTLLAVVSSFAFPAASYLFSIIAFLQLVALLMTTIFKTKFKQKFGMDMDRLFLSVIPLVLMMPPFMGLFLLLGDALGACMYPLIMVLPVLFSGFIVPYVDYLKPILNKFVKFLPAPSVRVVTTVEKKVEDPVKKGRFTTETVKETTRMKLVNKYRNWHGVTFVAFVSAIVILCVTAFGGQFSTNISGSANKNRPYTDDALIYVIDDSEDAVYSHYWKVADLDAYKYFAKAANDENFYFTWNATIGAYVMEDTSYSSSSTQVNDKKPSLEDKTVSDTSTKYKLSVPISDTIYSLTFTDADSIEKIIITAANNANNMVDAEYVPVDGQSTLTIADIRGDAQIEVVAKTGSYKGEMTFHGNFAHYRYNAIIDDGTKMAGFKLWDQVLNYYRDGDQAVFNNLKAGMDIRSTFSFAD